MTTKSTTMREVQATAAKAHLAQLLSAVERGESFAITRHGRRVAHLVPAAAVDAARRGEAVARFRARQQAWDKASFSRAEILAARHAGHRA
jgi:prevent-host-death family protein